MPDTSHETYKRISLDFTESVEVLSSPNLNDPFITRLLATGAEIQWHPSPVKAHGNVQTCGVCFAAVGSWGPTQWQTRDPWAYQIQHALWHASRGDL